MSRLLTIDIGTTTFKAYVYDERGTVLAHASVRPPDETIVVSGVAVDIWRPDELWDRVATLFTRVLEALPDRRVDALTIDHMGLVGVPLDDQGQPLGPFVTWIDPTHTRALLEGFSVDNATLFAATGNRCSAIYPPAWIAWLSRHVPGYADGLRWWVNPGDYIAYRLCGELATDYSMASQTTCFDQRRLQFREDFIRSFDLPPGVFPPPRPAATPLGPVSRSGSAATGLLMGTPVILGGADYICGPTGAGFIDPGDTTILTGTWELVVTCVTEPRLSPELESVGVVCDAHVAPDRWALRIENYAGDVTEWYKEELGAAYCPDPEDGFWDVVIAQAGAAVPGCGGLVFVPHLFGSLGPRYDELARGAFVGLTKRATRGEMARALFEGLNLQTRHSFEALLEATGLVPRRVVFMGGATRNRFWMQNRANVLGREVEMVTVPDVTPRGCAIIAGVGAGVFSSFHEGVAVMAPSTTVLRPDPREAEFYDELFTDVYRPLVDELAPFNTKLAGLCRKMTRDEGRPCSSESTKEEVVR
jgi:xylulokinase